MRSRAEVLVAERPSLLHWLSQRVMLHMCSLKGEAGRAVGQVADPQVVQWFSLLIIHTALPVPLRVTPRLGIPIGVACFNPKGNN